MIIDNEKNTMVDRLQAIMPEAVKIDIAVGYFFISGFAQIMDSLKLIEASNDPKHIIRILTSPVTDKITAEAQFAANEALDDIKTEAGQRDEPAEMRKNTVEGIRRELEHMPQSEGQKEAVRRLIDLIKKEKIRIKIYTKEQLHAKLYLLKLNIAVPQESIIGSSNFSVSGLRDHAELNLVTNDDKHYEGFHDWFEEHWDDPGNVQFTQDVAQILGNSWAGREYTPQDVAGKASLHENPEDPLPEPSEIGLYGFQEGAVSDAIRKSDEYGGVIIADVVGMGKSYMGAAVLRHLVDSDILDPVVICPARLIGMWEEIMGKFRLSPNVVSNSKLDDLAKYNHCNALLIDESHSFKDHKRARYQKLMEYMDNKTVDARVIMLTATPISTSILDLKNQLNLFPQDKIEKIPVLEDIRPDEGRTKIDGYFGMIDTNSMGVNDRDAIRDLLRHILIRRTRKKIIERCDKDENGRPYLDKGGKKAYFPERKLYRLEYDADKTYDGKFGEIEAILERLKLARYVPAKYLKEKYKNQKPYDRMTQTSLGGIVRISLLKRMESSIEAFNSSVNRYKKGNSQFLAQLERGKIPIGRRFEETIRRLSDEDVDDFDVDGELAKLGESEYEAKAFDISRWKMHISEDIENFERIIELLQGTEFTQRDDKLHKLLEFVDKKREKLLIFTESSVTAEYIFRYLVEQQKAGHLEERNIFQIDSGKGKSAINEAIIRFAPKFNKSDMAPDKEIDILISTDVLSEGLNLQQGRIIINYDFHWNPTRLIQRGGRIDRIGSEHKTIETYNFLTTPLVDKGLGLRERVSRRIDVMRSIVGTDGQVLVDTEAPDSKTVCDMYADEIQEYYEAHGMISTETEADLLAENIRKDAKRRQEIEALPYGIRSTTGNGKLLVACMAEDVLVMDSDRVETAEFRKYYEVTKDSVKPIKQSLFMRQIIVAGRMARKPEPSDYDSILARAWDRFRDDRKESTRYVPIRKYQKVFDRILKTMEGIPQKHILEMRSFVKSRMIQSRHPYRDLIRLYHDKKRKNFTDEETLERLFAIREKYERIVFKKIVKKPRILYSMMVDA